MFIWESIHLETRKPDLGKRNMVGARVTEARLAKGMKQKELLAKLQTAGIEISTPALSLLEGQKRPVMDYELNALADSECIGGLASRARGDVRAAVHFKIENTGGGAMPPPAGYPLKNLPICYAGTSTVSTPEHSARMVP